jgi:hypothetical protein
MADSETACWMPDATLLRPELIYPDASKEIKTLQIVANMASHAISSEFDFGDSW